MFIDKGWGKIKCVTFMASMAIPDGLKIIYFVGVAKVFSNSF